MIISKEKDRLELWLSNNERFELELATNSVRKLEEILLRNDLKIEFIDGRMYLVDIKNWDGYVLDGEELARLINGDKAKFGYCGKVVLKMCFL